MLQSIKQGFHPFQLQAGTKEAGEELFLSNQCRNIAIGNGIGAKIALQQSFITKGNLFGIKAFGEIYTGRRKPIFQLCQSPIPIGMGEVAFADKKESGNMIFPQQPPKSFGVGLDTVGAADNENSIVQHTQGALGFRGKINVTRGIQKSNLRITKRKPCLFGKDGDSSGPLQSMGIKKAISVINSPHLFDLTGKIKKPFGKGGFTGIHMGQKPQNDTLF